MRRLPGVVPLYAAAEMRTLDRITVEEVGLPGAVLMERAGMAAAAEIRAWFGGCSRVAIVCGTGNNGGDGFVVARHLAAAGCDVEVLLVEAASKVRREPRVFLTVLEQLGIPARRVNVTAWGEVLADRDIVVDAMLGTGVSGELRPSFQAAIRAIESSMLPVVALDMPSGVDADDGHVESAAVRADLTITFHAPKIGLAVAPGRFHAGRVKAVDIGIPRQAEAPPSHGIATPDLLQLVPPPRREGSKHDARVLCVGGARSMSGALMLTARGAMRAGAGVAWAAVPEELAQSLDVAMPEVQVRGMPGTEDGELAAAAGELLDPLVERAGVVVAGPGIGTGDGARAVVRRLVSTAPALVLDAQGLTALAGEPQALVARDGAPTLITPHEGELAKLLDVPVEDVRARRLQHAREAASQTQATVLLKGEDTLVVLPAGDFLVCRGHVAQATAGTGDVLAGVAGALLSRGLDPAMSGACAALACSLAATQAAADLGTSGVIASDLVDRLPAAIERRLAIEDESPGPAPTAGMRA